ncbi:hypothetical protein PO117_23875 [Bacteroides thetaiotaomicron]|jgi:hypothetical protein|nr:hypothetical protein [Bacteroides thetaiotaomicron]
METTLASFIHAIEEKIKEAEECIRNIKGCIAIPAQAVYVSLVCMVSLATFMLCILVLNLQFWHSSLIWKCLCITIGIAVIGVAMMHYIPKWIDKFQKP